MAGSDTGLAAFPGMRGTGNWAVPDERPLDYRQAAFKLHPDSPSVFTNLLSKLPSRVVDFAQFKIFEWRLPVMAVAQDATTDVATTLSSATAGANIAFKDGDLLRNETTGEIVLITADPSSPYTDLTVVRGWGATSGAAVTQGDVFRWVGSAYPEGSESPLAMSRAPSVVDNYTQIFWEAVKATKTATAEKMRPMKPWKQLKDECLERLMLKMEYAFMYGTPAEDLLNSSNNEYRRTTGGFYHFMNAANRIIDFSGGTYLSTIEDALATTFRHGTRTKVGLCGNQALSILNRAAHRNSDFTFSAERLNENQTYGLSVTKWHSPFGNLLLIPHPLLTESAEGTGQIFIVDTKYVEYVHLGGRDVQWKDNAEPNNADYKLGYFMAEAGLRLALPEVHAVWEGISSYDGTDAP